MRFKALILAMGTLAVAGTGAAAMAAMDVNDAYALCSRLSKKDSRLECYDQVARDAAAGRLQQSGPAPMQQAPQQSWAQPPASQGWGQPQIGGAPSPQGQAPAASFGAQSLPRGSAGRAEETGPEAIQAQVASSTDNGLGMWRVRLADGAIWQMTERVSMFRPPAPNETITIRKGALGSFFMDVGKQGAVRVSRVR